MLIGDVGGELSTGSIVKDSKFYIEVAKFVQAYRTIVVHPNVFLREIHESEIDEEHQRLNWEQFVKIVQNVDLGFNEIPSSTELVVMYNYALQIGSFEGMSRHIATVDDVANAQKHYYNFIDDAAGRAETEYIKQHKLYELREGEAKDVDGRLKKLKSLYFVSFAMMMIAVALMTFGVVSFFFSNPVVRLFGAFAGKYSNFVGGIIFIAIGFIIFVIFDRFFVGGKKRFFNLKVASELIFKRSDDSLVDEQIAKHKYEELKEDLKIVKDELNDKNKSYDVIANINRIKQSNKFYRALCENEIEAEYGEEEELEAFEEKTLVDGQIESAPIKLTKEQEENLARVSREAISLEGRFDEQAYNEKFENVTRAEDTEPEQMSESKENTEPEQMSESEENIETEEVSESEEDAEPTVSVMLDGGDDTELAKTQNKIAQEVTEQEERQQIEEEKEEEEESDSNWQEEQDRVSREEKERQMAALEEEQERARQEELYASIDYIKEILGLNSDGNERTNY